MGAHIGYRYNRQKVADGQPADVTGDTYDPGSGAALAHRGSCALVKGVLPAACTHNNPGVTALPPLAGKIANIHGNTLLIGGYARPSTKLRLSTDLEYYTADHSFARVDPRSALLLNPLTPTGPLPYDYFRPTAGLDFQLAPGTVVTGTWLATFCWVAPVGRLWAGFDWPTPLGLRGSAWPTPLGLRGSAWRRTSGSAARCPALLVASPSCLHGVAMIMAKWEACPPGWRRFRWTTSMPTWWGGRCAIRSRRGERLCDPLQ